MQALALETLAAVFYSASVDLVFPFQGWKTSDIVDIILMTGKRKQNDRKFMFSVSHSSVSRFL